MKNIEENSNFDNESPEIFNKEENNQLDDIVLQQYEKKEKVKRVAIILSAILFIFIVVISIVKFITDSSSTPQDSLVQEDVFSTNVEQNSQNDREDFEEVPIVNEEKSEDLIQPTDKVQTKEKLNKIVDTIIEKELTDSKKQKVNNISQTPQQKSQVKKEISSDKQSRKRSNSTQTRVNQKQKSNQSSIRSKSHKNQDISQKQKKKKIKTVGNYFIQVGAFLKYDPDKKFLRKITSHGYHYTIKKFVKNGTKIKRVYIGPFKDRAEAKQALKKIRKSIANGAFIVRL